MSQPMSDAPRQEIPLPKGDDDFEDLILALFREVWQDTGSTLHGRSGQRQDGVDLYGEDRFGRSGLNGVQCKHHGSATPIKDKDLLDELRAEVEKAKGFRPPLQRFIFATTARRSVALQQEARNLTELHKKAGLFAVEVLGWEDIEDLLRRHSGVLAWYRDERAKRSGLDLGRLPIPAPHSGGAGMTKSFDVFLSHNSKDKPAVRVLAEALRARGLKVWLDEWELVPGQPWQEALEEIIETTRSSAVLVGKDGIGPWQDAEMRGCLSEFVERKLPVIPVLLPGAPEAPRLPFFLKRFTWVDLRGGLTEEGIDRLQWGVTGKRPDPSKLASIPAKTPEVLLGRLRRLSIFLVVSAVFGLAAAYLFRWPHYVDAEQLFHCIGRGSTCAGTNPLTLGGREYRRGIIRTQPNDKTNGHSEVSFRVVRGARYLLFTVGNPFTGEDCSDAPNKPMLMYVHIDGDPKPAWEAPVSQVYVDQRVEIPEGAQTITLIGNTGDRSEHCDDSAWAEVRFEN